MKEELATRVERIERLLALLLIQNMKTANMATKARELSIAGFTNVEIADILGTTAAVIGQSLYAARKGNKKVK
jgi:predicted transcriptional regulator